MFTAKRHAFGGLDGISIHSDSLSNAVSQSESICDAGDMRKRRNKLEAFSPGAEGNSDAQDYLVGRPYRCVGPDWHRNVVWRQNIYCHPRTGWLSRQAASDDDWCKRSA
jgi:hypothetical protein